jgi:hypothetical protein
MDPPFTRAQLQSFDLNSVMRKMAIDTTVKHLTNTILQAASGLPSSEWTLVGRVLTIPHAFALRQRWQLNPFNLNANGVPFDDILPDVVDRLKSLFPDVEIRLEETTVVVDWS